MIELHPKPKTKTFQDLEGKTFGRWTVLGYAGRSNRLAYWWCECDCGSIRRVRAATLKRGKNQSCASLGKGNRRTHGMRYTREYRSWAAMVARCNYVRDPGYQRYGGRGIQVCNRWLSFEYFFADMGRRPKDMTLERIDNDDNYCPGNCKWATRKEQASNMRSNRRFVIGGKSKTLAELAESAGINYRTLWNRVKRGWPIEEALSRSVKCKTKK